MLLDMKTMKDIGDEIENQMFIRCPLKVLIPYRDCNYRVNLMT